MIAELAHWSPLLQREDPNLTAAIDVACEEGWIDDALRLVGRLCFWWTAAQGRHRLRPARDHLRSRLRADLPTWYDETDDAGPFLWLGTHLDDAEPVIQTAATAGARLTAGRTLSPSDRYNGRVASH